MTTNILFDCAINRKWPGEKLPLGDRRFGLYNGSFEPEQHAIDSFAAEIAKGHSFCSVLGGCDLDHCGGRFCCPERKNAPDHCGRPQGYRANRHFKSAQIVALDSDTGDEFSSLDFYLAEDYFREYGALIYTTLSHTPQAPKCRPVFVLDTPITDFTQYRLLKVAMMRRYAWTDAAVKDPARFLYGTDCKAGHVEILGNTLPRDVVKTLIDSERASEAPDSLEIPRVALVLGESPAAKYVATAINRTVAHLSGAGLGTGDRYPRIIPAALSLQSLKMSTWLPQDIRDNINVAEVVLTGCGANGALDHYGEDHIRRAIEWAVARAEPRPAPPHQTQRGGTHLPQPTTNWSVTG